MTASPSTFASLEPRSNRTQPAAPHPRGLRTPGFRDRSRNDYEPRLRGGTATVELTVERTDDEWQILEFKVVEFMSLSKLKNNTLVPPSTVEQ